MTAADRMDLALCGGYELVECGCDCPRCKGQYWDRVEMPVVGCEPTMQMLIKMTQEAIHKRMDQQMATILQRIQNEDFWGNVYGKSGDTITVKRPERWQA